MQKVLFFSLIIFFIILPTYSVNILQEAFGATVELDQKVYSWTDKVQITIFAPTHNFDGDLVDEIGNSSLDPIKISTRGFDLDNYKLVETGTDTGIFTGEVILTGFTHDADGDGTNDTNPRTTGSGPTDGFLQVSNNDDGLTVSFEFSEDETVVGSALIRWNIGEVQWLEASYSDSGTGVVRVIDPDMNLNPEAVDNFDVDVWSDSDTRGIDLTVTETNEATGIFEGTVFFTTSGKSSGHQLKVTGNDVITAEYEDNTLPDPYTTADELDITAISHIESSTIVCGEGTELVNGICQIVPKPPTIQYQHSPEKPYVGDMIFFDATSSTDDGSIVKYEWLFDGEIIKMGSTTSYKYSSEGEKTITLTITDNDNRSTTKEFSVIVFNPLIKCGEGTEEDDNGICQPIPKPPTIQYQHSPEKPYVGDMIFFDATSSTDDGSIVKYEWLFDGEIIKMGSTTSYKYSSEGEKTITLTITDNDNRSTTKEFSVIVFNPPFDYTLIISAIAIVGIASMIIILLISRSKKSSKSKTIINSDSSHSENKSTCNVCGTIIPKGENVCPNCGDTYSI